MVEVKNVGAVAEAKVPTETPPPLASNGRASQPTVPTVH